MKPSERLIAIEVRQANQNILPSDSFWLLARVKKLEEALVYVEENTGHITPCSPRDEGRCYAGCEFRNRARKALDNTGGEK